MRGSIAQSLGGCGVSSLDIFTRMLASCHGCMTQSSVKRMWRETSLNVCWCACIDRLPTLRVPSAKFHLHLLSTSQTLPSRNSSIVGETETFATNLCPSIVKWRSISPSTCKSVLLAAERNNASGSDTSWAPISEQLCFSHNHCLKTTDGLTINFCSDVDMSGRDSSLKTSAETVKHVLVIPLQVTFHALELRQECVQASSRTHHVWPHQTDGCP